MNGPDYAARAAAGAVFLDEHRPGWAGQVDLFRLDLADMCDCVLGQIGGHYRSMREELGLKPEGAVALGFSLGPPDPPQGWHHLDAAWAAEITRRREPAQLCRAHPDDCPNGPEPHAYYNPPEFEGQMCCCRQPDEEMPS